MTRGIRDAVAEKFVTTLPQFQSGELTGTQLRKAVMDVAVNEFGTSIASAATHYNFALKQMRLVDPKAVEGLGRPEDKKGGRPVLKPVTVIKVKTGEVVKEGISREAASQLVILANSTKGKAKLAIREEQVQESAPA